MGPIFPSNYTILIAVLQLMNIHVNEVLLKPLPCWTSFPHPKYSTLNKLAGRFTELSNSSSTNVPEVLLIENGVHEIQDEHHNVYHDA